MSEKPPKDAKMMRVGLITALGIAIHNFPERYCNFRFCFGATFIGCCYCYIWPFIIYRKESPFPFQFILLPESPKSFSPLIFIRLVRAARSSNSLLDFNSIYYSLPHEWNSCSSRRYYGFYCY